MKQRKRQWSCRDSARVLRSELKFDRLSLAVRHIRACTICGELMCRFIASRVLEKTVHTSKSGSCRDDPQVISASTGETKIQSEISHFVLVEGLVSQVSRSVFYGATFQRGFDPVFGFSPDLVRLMRIESDK